MRQYMIQLTTIRYAGKLRALGSNTAVRILLDLDARRIVRADPFRRARPAWQKRAFAVTRIVNLAGIFARYVHFLYVVSGFARLATIVQRVMI